MEDKPFLDPDSKPAESSLASVLEGAYPQYKNLLILTRHYSQDWSFSRSSGWMLKVHGNKKALFYLIPMLHEFKISMAIRENEREVLLGDLTLQDFHSVIFEAKKFIEGYALQFMVANDEDFQKVKPLLNQLISLRGLKG